MSNEKSIFLSIIIPVYNSADIIDDTVIQIIDEFKKNNYTGEIILVNDGSRDNSWVKIEKLARQYAEVTSINLLKNFGQHSAQYCALNYTKGSYVITMDDDLQNPPDQIPILVDKALEGYDLVIAKFTSKQHANYRKLGTRIVNYFIQKIFSKPKDLHMTNFRIFSHKVVDRLLKYKTNYPYIPGLLLIHSSSMVNVLTHHDQRKMGKSNYSTSKIVKLISRLLINYSSYPLKMLTFLGLFLALFSFLFGFRILIQALSNDDILPGWASIMVMMSFLNGISILMMGVLGIYISRTMEQISKPEAYIIDEIVN